MLPAQSGHVSIAVHKRLQFVVISRKIFLLLLAVNSGNTILPAALPTNKENPCKKSWPYAPYCCSPKPPSLKPLVRTLAASSFAGTQTATHRIQQELATNRLPGTATAELRRARKLATVAILGTAMGPPLTQLESEIRNTPRTVMAAGLHPKKSEIRRISGTKKAIRLPARLLVDKDSAIKRAGIDF